MRRPTGRLAGHRLVATALIAVSLVGIPSAATRAAESNDERWASDVSLTEIGEQLAEAQAERGDLARAAAVAEQQVADAQRALEAAGASRQQADEVYADALARQSAAEQQASAARQGFDDVTQRLAAAVDDYEEEHVRLEARAREAYKQSTGGWAAEGEAVLNAIVSEDQLAVALERIQMLRRVTARQADTAAKRADLARQVQEMRLVQAQHAAWAQTAADEAVAATNTAQDARTKSRVLTQREAATYQAAQQLVVALKQRRETQEATITALTKASDELAERAKVLGAATTADAVPRELVGFGNGRVPSSALEPIGRDEHRLWGPAATAFMAMIDAADAEGVTIGVTDSYRSYPAQVDVARRKGLYAEGGLAARPGTSNHGWGLALDLDLDAAALAWMRTNADRFGFVEDTPREPWHWGFHARR